MSGKKYQFDNNTDTLIRDRYDSHTETIDELARSLGLPRWTVKKRAQALGLAHTKEKPWSQDEVAYLEDNMHRLSLSSLAKRLGRTVTAVALKSKRLGIRKSDEGYTARSLAEAFGVDSHKVARWVALGLIRASRRKSGASRDMYFISDQEVKRFICTHPMEFDIRRVDQLWFVDVLVGVRS